MFSDTYYHKRINQTYRFLIPEGKSVLYFGPDKEGIVPVLKTKECDIVSDVASLPEKTYDFVIFNGVIGDSEDICGMLKNVKAVCHDSTRIIIYQHNYIWSSFINLAERLGIKKRDVVQNWISINDLKSLLNGLGFQTIRTFRKTIFPLQWLMVGPVLNFLTDIIPILDFLKLDQFVVARPTVEPTDKDKSLSIVLTVRNEKGNIEPIVQSLPVICDNQEILFVEGHSTDGTREEIERVMELNPYKNVRVIGQPGKGQGDAIRVGFKEAKGDVIILYEGDGTSDPNDIQYFYDAVASGQFDFVEGSRFIYPLDKKCMPFLKQLGNLFFARWFTWFLGIHTTDVLSGIKAISKTEYETVYDNWGFLGFDDPFGDFELLYGAFRFGSRFCEIPMRYQPRPYGESKTHVFGHGVYLLRMAWRGYCVFRSTHTKDGFNL